MRGEPFYYCHMGDRLREYRQEAEMDRRSAELRPVGGICRGARARSGLAARLPGIIERLAAFGGRLRRVAGGAFGKGWAAS